MNDKTIRMIGLLEKEAIVSGMSMIVKMFFNKMTLNDLIMRTKIGEDHCKFSLNYHPACTNSSNSVIYQKESGRPYFFIHRSLVVSSLVEHMISRNKEEKEMSNVFDISLEIEGKVEKLEFYFDPSSLWIKVESAKLDGVWNEMLIIKGLAHKIAA